ncbi:MAG TPA: DUF502 domain-containing protein [Planctomycetaceae bacterium]|nr:DUF502 domain-containing protein [Planctomycetaceae bacterium]
MADDPAKTDSSEAPSLTPTRFFLRGLAISLPPILTIVILVWLAGAINDYIIAPTSSVVRFAFAQAIEKSVPTSTLVQWEKLPPLEYCRNNYRITPEFRKELQQRLDQQIAESDPLLGIEVESVMRNVDKVYVPFGTRAVPYEDYYEVASNLPAGEMPPSSIGLYMELVTTRYFKSVFQLSLVAVMIAIVLLYFLGRIVTVKLGQWFVHKFESGVLARVPVVSNVYSSVKQVTDFFFTERTISYNQVVAVEYPRKGMWSIGFVTSSGMQEIADHTGEPMVSLLMPTSPMPMTGFTITVPRKEVIELDLTIDQAFQFCLSCGVLVPPHQKANAEILNKQARQLLETSPPSVGDASPSHSGEEPSE